MADEEPTPNPQSPGADPWASLAPGDPLMVVKLAPDGSEVARYPAAVDSLPHPGSWLSVRATWTYRQIDVEGLIFAPGDALHEWFSPGHDFNAFAVHAPDGAFKGWYANVTYPAHLDTGTTPSTLTWHDLYLDVVALPEASPVVCDEDELAASGLAQSDPRLWQRIWRARDEILLRLDRQLPPFAAGRERVP